MVRSLALALTVLALRPSVAWGTTYTVTTTADSGAGSLRAAIIAANAGPDADVIDFAIGTGSQTITLSSALPPIGGPATIDATTQPGYAGAPLVVLDGAATMAPTDGLVVDWNAWPSTIRGLAIVDFPGWGISVTSVCCVMPGAVVSISDDYLGTVASGADRGNLAGGISIPQSGVRVTHSVVSGNDGPGVRVTGIYANDIRITGSLIGTTPDGQVSLGNAGPGIELASDDALQAPGIVTVGGPAAGDGNVISGNGASGIAGVASQLTVLGNRIGTTADGLTELGNAGDGIEFDAEPEYGSAWIGNDPLTGVSTPNLISANSGAGVAAYGMRSVDVRDNVIGWSASGAPLGNGASGIWLGTSGGGDNTIGENRIGSNGGDGVAVTGSKRVSISRNAIAANEGAGIAITGGGATRHDGNSIVANGGLGVDVAEAGVTANDSGDTDGFANFPTITSVVTRESRIAVDAVTSTTEAEGTIAGAPNTKYTLEFFTGASCDPSGYGEGETPAGQGYVTTDAAGIGNFKTAMRAVQPGRILTAVAARRYTTTSEFSACATVGYLPAPPWQNTAPPIPPPALSPQAPLPQGLTLRIAPQRLKRVLAAGLKVTASCGASCVLRVSVSVDRATAKKLRLVHRPKGRVTVASGRAGRSSPGPVVVTARFTVRAKKVLAAVKRVRLQIVAQDTNRHLSAARTITLRR